MRYAQIRRYDVANGTGIRTTIFFSGCTHNCPSCFNKEYQSFRYGSEYTKETEELLLEYLKDPNVKGLSVLGGEPLQQDPSKLLSLLKRVKGEIGKDIWVWTGYTLEEIPKQYSECLELIDILVDGRFVPELKSAMLQFRGSKNQRVIDVQSTLKLNQVISHLE